MVAPYVLLSSSTFFLSSLSSLGPSPFSDVGFCIFFLPTIYGFSSFYRHRLTFYDWYPPSLLWLILWLIWRLGLSACWSHRGTRARVLGLPPPFRPLVLVLGFLSAPRTLNGVAMVDRPHYHPHAPLLLTANLVFFFHASTHLIFDFQIRKFI